MTLEEFNDLANSEWRAGREVVSDEPIVRIIARAVASQVAEMGGGDVQAATDQYEAEILDKLAAHDIDARTFLDDLVYDPEM